MSFVWETPEEINMALAKRLSQIRRRRNLSQQALSEKSNVSFGSIKRFETTGQISLISLTKLCVALDCVAVLCPLEGDGDIGFDGAGEHLTGLSIDAGGNVYGKDFGIGFIDAVDGLGKNALGCAGKPRAEDAVDDDVIVFRKRVQRYLRDVKVFADASVFERVALELFNGGKGQDVRLDAPQVQHSGTSPRIAAVVAKAADAEHFVRGFFADLLREGERGTLH